MRRVLGRRCSGLLSRLRARDWLLAARRDRPARAGAFGAADYDALSAVGEEQSSLVGVELRRRGLREPEVVAGTLRRQRHTASLLMAAAGYPGPCGTDKRWDEFDHLALLSRYVDPARVEPTRQDSRAFQRLLDEALEAWTRDGGWAAFTADALAALQDVAEAVPKGRDAVVVSSGGVIGALAAGLLGAPAATGIALTGWRSTARSPSWPSAAGARTSSRSTTTRTSPGPAGNCSPTDDARSSSPATARTSRSATRPESPHPPT